MKGYSDLLNVITTQLKKDQYCKTVTEGSIFNVGLEKQSIYPVAHIEIGGFKRNNAALDFSVSLICMDIVKSDYSNEKDVMTTQSAVCLRVAEVFNRSTYDKYTIIDEPNFEFFRDKFEHSVAGCTMTFNISIPNDMTII